MATELAVHPKVCAAFPDLHIDVVAASGFDGSRDWPDVERQLAGLESLAQAGSPPPADEHDQHIAAWHEAYRSFGTNPRRQRPSVHALRRRLARTGRLPRINPAVDCYNLISVRFGVPAGAFDLAQVRGDITVRFAAGDETFTPLGEPGVAEIPRPGEVIYADAEGVLTRHWNHRDAERTKVTPATSELVVVLETTRSAAFCQVVDEAAGALAGLLEERARRVSVQHITAASPAVPLPGG